MQINRRKHILFVDENPDEVEIALKAFAEANARDQISIAHSTEEALAYLHGRTGLSGLPAVMLLAFTTLKLEELKGLRAIKSELAFREIPVVIFAPAYEETLAREGYALGANSYIVKPVDFQHYLKLIKGLVAFWISLNERPRSQAPTLATPKQDYS